MKSRVAVLRTSPDRVVEDYGRLMRMAGYEQFCPKGHETLLKINISWHHYYPACSTSPWQYDGVVTALRTDGWDTKNLIPAHNRTVVVDDKVGMERNHIVSVDRKHGLKPVHLYEPPVKWVVYQPKGRFRVLGKVFPDGVRIPEMFIGKNIIHLPTVKTHVFTQITGAMKNAFGGLLSERRHWTHSVIHETLVDLLLIQKEIHSGVFAVMDGTVVGDGPGPRAMIPHVENLILASGDQVAIDAVSAKIQGFDPLSLDFIRCAHEDKLGCGDVRDIEIIGEDISKINFHHMKNAQTLASKGQRAIYHGPLKPLEGLLLRSPLVPWSFMASKAYHDLYWFPFIGKKRVNDILATAWGDLFRSYGLPEEQETEAKSTELQAG